ncbi:MAG: hypothetical protein JSS69_01485 [Acidobacteria bacterium]|nr:hypothetical protein [Acidobacteriota bacterium]MBS1864566.1 hypothetical protein [Acidobacteriota bacterium]
MTSPVSEETNRRFAGIAGLLGALLFFAGDMLFCGHLGSGANFHQGMLDTVRHASLARLYAGGLVGPVAACLCVLGFWHVYRNVNPPRRFLAKFMLVCFAVLMIFGSAVHALWTAKGLAMQNCYGSDDAGCRALLPAINSYWSLAYNLGAAPGYLAAILLIGFVILGKSRYPRWTVLANPAFLILLSPLAEQIPAPLGAILVGGSANLAIAFFFLISILTTWKTPEPAAS